MNKDWLVEYLEDLIFESRYDFITMTDAEVFAKDIRRLISEEA